MINIDEVKKRVLKKLKEISTTGGSASFSPGSGEQYATKYAFNPNKKAQGTARNYYYKMGFKPVNREEVRKKSKGIVYRDLFN